jgi:hypothetical protein
MARRSSIPPSTALRERLSDLVMNEADVRWAEHHRAGAVLERAPAGTPPRGLHELTGPVFEGDVDFVAIRGDRESIVGFAHDEPAGSIWCGLDPGTVLGAALTALRERTGSASLSRTSLPGGFLGEAAIGKDRGLPEDVLRELMARSKELSAVILVDGAGTHCLACRELFPKDEGGERLAVLDALLRGVRALPRDGDSGDGVGFPYSSMVASSPFGWFFGSHLLDGTARDLWIALDPGTTQGLGWALLTALLRRTSLTSHQVAR